MHHTDNGAFSDTRMALFLVRLLAELETARQGIPQLDSLIATEEKKNGFQGPVPLVNQTTFLEFAYMTLVYTREAYFSLNSAVVEKKVEPFLAWISFFGSRVEGRHADAARKPAEVLRWLRNALGHSGVEVEETEFILSDQTPRKPDDYVTMVMDWPVLGQICEAVVWAGNEVLYEQPALGPSGLLAFKLASSEEDLKVQCNSVNASEARHARRELARVTCDVDYLCHEARNGTTGVKLAVAGNRCTPPNVLVELLKSGSRHVQQAAVTNLPRAVARRRKH